jgi:2-polyprenyl-3-methyl-5-hydroxy-6-metoxy-1,4-benzoquinol methylase
VSHSAYFDVLLGGGIVAGLLLAAVLVFGFANAGSRAVEGRHRTCLPIALVTTVAVAATQESILIGNNVVFALFVAGACWRRASECVRVPQIARGMSPRRTKAGPKPCETSSCRASAGITRGRWTLLQPVKLGRHGPRRPPCARDRGPSAMKSERVSHSPNVDVDVIDGFGSEWSRFTNERLSAAELSEIFGRYFSIFPWSELPADAVGFDAGCGSGRWARFVAGRVGELHCIDASEAALDVARHNLTEFKNVSFYLEDLSQLSLPDGSCDFGYSVGVLHHIPDPLVAARECVAKLKPDAPFLVYLYYSLEDSTVGRRLVLRFVTALRYVISRLPRRARQCTADVIAVLVYAPLAWTARMAERLGRDPSVIPLFQYRTRSFYVMRNDALDRFGTRLEHRFTRQEVLDLLDAAGVDRVSVSDDPPWWVAVGRRRVRAG